MTVCRREKSQHQSLDGENPHASKVWDLAPERKPRPSQGLTVAVPVHLRARRYFGNRDHGLVQSQVRVRLIRKFLACASEKTYVSVAFTPDLTPSQAEKVRDGVTARAPLPLTEPGKAVDSRSISQSSKPRRPS